MLKLARLPDRNPVRLTLLVTPELDEALKAYALAYRETYGVEAPMAELAAAMLAAFIASDRAFIKQRQERGRAGAVQAPPGR